MSCDSQACNTPSLPNGVGVDKDVGPLFRMPADIGLDFFPPPVRHSNALVLVHKLFMVLQAAELEELGKLTPQQRAAVKHVVDKAQAKSNHALPALQARILGLGWVASV